MVTTGATAAMIPIIAAATQHTSSYRVKFKRKEFLELVETAKPKIIYNTERMHFLVFDGFVMYSFECRDGDLKQKVGRATLKKCGSNHARR